MGPLTAAAYLRGAFALLVAATMIPPAEALLSFDGGRDTVTATAEYGFSYDSNLFVHAGGEADYSQTFTASADYLRRAGLIKVDAALKVAAARFEKFTGQDFTNPSLTAAFTKDQGRLTGSIKLSAARESISDMAANLRANSWNYGTSLQLRYPINDRYYFTSATDYSATDYIQEPALFNLTSYAESLDMYYRYNSKLDLLAGYRERIGVVEGGGNTHDHDVHLGATGSILPKLSGTIQLGYQWRDEAGAAGGRFDGLSSSLALSWPMTSRVAFHSVVSKDFMTTATDISVDVTSITVSTVLRPGGRLAVNLGLGYSVSRYLGRRGDGREDHTPTAEAGISLPISSHFSASLSYAYTFNQSNLAYSYFRRHTATLSVSARF